MDADPTPAPMIGVCCDSGAQLPIDLVERYGIEVVPFTVTVDGVEHLEGVGLDAKRFWALFKDGATPEVTTAAPGPGQIAGHYQRLVDRGATAIVSVHTGAEVSGLYDAARLAADLVTVPVELVDTESASFVVGCAALAAAEAVAAGASAADAAAEARAVAGRCENVFIVGALDLARSGGRLAADADELALPGSVPVLRLRQGKMEVTGDADSPDRAAELMAAEILSSGDRLRVGIAIADRSSTRVAATLRYLLESSSADLELIDYRVGPSVGAHTGPGTAGAVYHSR